MSAVAAAAPVYCAILLVIRIRAHKRVTGTSSPQVKPLASRNEFLLDSAHTHLNHASFGATPKEVYSARSDILREVERHPDEHFRYAAFGNWQKSVQAAVCLCGGDPADVTLVPNATAGVNVVVNSLTVSGSSVAVVASTTYRACRHAVYEAFELRGGHILELTLGVSDLQSPQNIARAYEKQIQAYQASNPNRVIEFALIDHITSPTGVVMPIQTLTEYFHGIGAKVMIDGAHAPGNIPDFDISGGSWDFYTANLHKWCFVPRGCGLLYIAPGNTTRVRPVLTSHFYDQPLQARFFMQGTVDLSTALSVPAAAAFIHSKGGLSRCVAYTRRLATRAGRRLLDEWHTRTLVPIHMTANMISVQMPLNPAATQAFLAQDTQFQQRRRTVVLEEPFRLTPEAQRTNLSTNSIAVSEYMFINHKVMAAVFEWEEALWCRISAAIYNTMQDYEVLLKAVDELRRKVDAYARSAAATR